MPHVRSPLARRTVAVGLVLVGTACSSDPTAISVEMATDRVSRELVDKALGEFRRACGPLFTTHAGDVSGLTAVVTDEGSTAVRRLGWGAHIALTMKVRASPTTLAGLPDPDRRADFLIGGGTHPGFSALSPTSARLCDLTPTPGRSQVFREVPGLANLLPRMKYAVTEAQRAHWADEMARAMAGTYQNQRNVAWCYTDGCDGVEPIDDVKACAWRLVIVAAKHPKAEASDAENVEIDCRRNLTPDEQRAARVKADELFRKIYVKPLPK
ncbi:MAG: hypothetical protein OEL76_13850 [Siculibacillus sp.]|nr:hypothetical protein [Siculibacillus sp.]